MARYSLAVDRKFKREGEPTADFVTCVAFGKAGEFAEKYFTKGMRIAVSGRITTGSYTNKDGVKVYTTEVTVEEHEFAQSKSENESEKEVNSKAAPTDVSNNDGFMNFPEGLDEELPFS